MLRANTKPDVEVNIGGKSVCFYHVPGASLTSTHDVIYAIEPGKEVTQLLAGTWEAQLANGVFNMVTLYNYLISRGMATHTYDGAHWPVSALRAAVSGGLFDNATQRPAKAANVITLAADDVRYKKRHVHGVTTGQT